jgi:hypothetical protein
MLSFMQLGYHKLTEYFQTSYREGEVPWTDPPE